MWNPKRGIIYLSLSNNKKKRDGFVSDKAALDFLSHQTTAATHSKDGMLSQQRNLNGDCCYMSSGASSGLHKENNCIIVLILKSQICLSTSIF